MFFNGKLAISKTVRDMVEITIITNRKSHKPYAISESDEMKIIVLG